MVSRSTSNNEISLGTNYKLSLQKKLGSGAFGEIYKGFNTKTTEGVAIKMEANKNKQPLLKYETGVLRYLQGGVGIPIVYDYLPSSDYNFMIMELLGPSLEALFDHCNRKFTLKTILIVGDQMLSRIEFLHMRHVIHRDIKPDNFLIGIQKKINQVYVIDFGLAKRFRDPKTGLHIIYKDGKSLTGTARYASIYTHLGIEQSRRDDLESLAYSLIYFTNGFLPWQGAKAKSKSLKYQKILEKKINVRPEDVCKDLPEEFVAFLQYTRNLQFEEKPDYVYLKDLIAKMYNRHNYEYDMMYDWICLIDNNQTFKPKKKKVEKIQNNEGNNEDHHYFHNNKEDKDPFNNESKKDDDNRNNKNNLIIDNEDNYEKMIDDDNDPLHLDEILKETLNTNDFVTENAKY